MPKLNRPKRRSIAFQLFLVLVSVVVVSIGVTWSISPIDPVGWQSQPAPALIGNYEPNGRLANIDRLSVPNGPEDVAVNPAGDIITGVSDGRLMRVTLGESPEVFAQLGGRPLGMDWHPDGRLIVCVADVGLVAVAEDGTTEIILSRYNGADLKFLDDVDVADDGTIYVTEATNRFSYADWKLDIIESRGSGRLFRIAPDGGVTVLMHDLHFANGVAVANDQSYVLVVETSRYRVRRLVLGDTPSSATLIDNLPGFPDGISNAGDDTFWLTIASPRNRLMDLLSGVGGARRLIGSMPKELLPAPQNVAHVMRLSASGVILQNLDDRSESALGMITNAEQVGGNLYLGSLHGGQIGVYHLSDEEADPQGDADASGEPVGNRAPTPEADGSGDAQE
ncbi:MAG: sugar lactone lactonase YvrE [Bradymonadia bacterium]|jgi:sugar lactone lactonase YvrE